MQEVKDMIKEAGIQEATPKVDNLDDDSPYINIEGLKRVYIPKLEEEGLNEEEKEMLSRIKVT